MTTDSVPVLRRVDAIRGQPDQQRGGRLWVLMALSFVVAAFGMANTLANVLEQTRTGTIAQWP